MSSALAKTEQKGLVVATFDLPVFNATPEEVAMVMQENMEGLRPTFDRIKIPSGGGIAFEVMDENGNASPASEITGVMIDHYPVNAYWAEKYSGANNAPDCSALDGKFGVGNPGGSCLTCPMNQWGSDPEGGKGKACKNIHRIYLLREGEAFPIMIALPPSSLGNLTQYITRLSSKFKHFSSVVTRVKLQKATNATGIVYSEAVFSKAADLTPQEFVTLKKYADSLKPAMRAVVIEGDDYEVSATKDKGLGDEFASETGQMF